MIEMRKFMSKDGQETYDSLGNNGNRYYMERSKTFPYDWILYFDSG